MYELKKSILLKKKYVRALEVACHAARVPQTTLRFFPRAAVTWRQLRSVLC